MRAALTKTEQTQLYHLVSGEEVHGPNPKMTGNCTGLSGNCSGLSGNCTGLSGNLDDCEISDDDRKAGINIQDLVKKEGTT